MEVSSTYVATASGPLLTLSIIIIDLDGSSYGGHYGSGYMQKNPSYNQASTHSSYSYHNPAFGHGTSSTQGNYPEDRTSSGYHGEGYHYSG